MLTSADYMITVVLYEYILVILVGFGMVLSIFSVLTSKAGMFAELQETLDATTGAI